MNKKRISLLMLTSAISFGAYADTTVVEHYCGKNGVKFKESVKVGAGERVYIGFGSRAQIKGKNKQPEPEALIENVNADFKTTKDCQDFMTHRYKEDPAARVTFEFNKDRLTSSAKFVLDGVRDKKATYNIVGNTDSVGSETYNLELGGGRAHEVAQYLEENGLPYGSTRVISLGEMNPIALNNTDEGRRLNRRVDVTLAK